MSVTVVSQSPPKKLDYYGTLLDPSFYKDYFYLDIPPGNWHSMCIDLIADYVLTGDPIIYMTLPVPGSQSYISPLQLGGVGFTPDGATHYFPNYRIIQTVNAGDSQMDMINGYAAGGTDAGITVDKGLGPVIIVPPSGVPRRMLSSILTSNNFFFGTNRNYFTVTRLALTLYDDVDNPDCSVIGKDGTSSGGRSVMQMQAYSPLDPIQAKDDPIDRSL